MIIFLQKSVCFYTTFCKLHANASEMKIFASITPHNQDTWSPETVTLNKTSGPCDLKDLHHIHRESSPISRETRLRQPYTRKEEGRKEDAGARKGIEESQLKDSVAAEKSLQQKLAAESSPAGSSAGSSYKMDQGE